jgi:predicted dienelactone hydrolase
MSESIDATGIAGAPAPVLSFGPLVLPVPGHAVDLQMRVSAPATGSGLPVILLSHGHGPSNHLSSLNGYAPLANYWAAHGFAVIQPTHLDSATLGLRDSDDPEAPLYWRSRARDMTRILDQLDAIEAAVPQLPGRLDRSRVAVAGHSMGGHSASMLLGARLTDPRDGTEVNLTEPRIKAGVLLAAPGQGGDALSEFAAEHYSFFSTMDFSAMTTPALVVAGDKDASAHLTVLGPEWHTDPSTLPGPKSSTVFGAGAGQADRGYDARTPTRTPAGGRGRAALGLPPHRAARGSRLAGRRDELAAAPPARTDRTKHA